MAARHSPRAPVDLYAPEPWGICDRCGFRYLLRDLPFQYDWRGNSLVNIGLRVCTLTCYDVPNEQFRPILIGPDPKPVRNPRPGFMAQQEGFVADDVTTETGVPVTDEFGNPVPYE